MQGFAITTGVISVAGRDRVARGLHFDDRYPQSRPEPSPGGVLATLVDTAVEEPLQHGDGEAGVAANTQLTIAFPRPGREGLLSVLARARGMSEHVLQCEAQVEGAGHALCKAPATFTITKR